MTANKLLTEGSIVWDIPQSQQPTVVSDVPSLLSKIHDTQDDKLNRNETDLMMSYHVSHGLIWCTVATTTRQTDMTTFSFTRMAQEYCNSGGGDHHHDAVMRECYHGIGHGVFYLVLQKQLQVTPQHNPSATVLRPSTGFQLTNQSWCDVYDLCLDATAVTKTEIAGYYYSSSSSLNLFDVCLGGVRHSVRLLASEDDERWHHTTPENIRIDYFNNAMGHCH
jgi:hypothetical protein